MLLLSLSRGYLLTPFTNLDMLREERGVKDHYHRVTACQLPWSYITCLALVIVMFQLLL